MSSQRRTSRPATTPTATEPSIDTSQPTRQAPTTPAKKTPAASPRPSTIPISYQSLTEADCTGHRAPVAAHRAPFQPADHVEAERGGAQPVDDPMVERDRHVAHLAHHDLAVTDDRAAGPTRCSPRMATSGWLMSGVTSTPPSLPALVMVKVEPRSSSGCERARSRGVREAPHVGVELLHRARVAAAHDRHDEAVVRLHGDAEVVAVEEHDLVPLEPRVQLGELAQRQGGCAERPGDERGQVDAREVALLDEGDRRHLAVGARHLLDDQAPHASHREYASPRHRPHAWRARRPR